MKKILIIMALAISLATVASGQVVKDLVGRVTAAVSVGGGNYHCAFTSSYGYAHTSIAAGDEYAVRNGNDVVRYQVNSTTTVGVLPGYNIILNMTAMDGYGGSFPTAVAEVYRPTTNWGLSLVDPNVPVILQWGLVNKNFLEIDSTMGLFVQYSDSTITFVTPDQLADSLAGYVEYSDSLVTFVTPTQLADSLVEAKEIYFTTTVPTGHATYKMAVDTVGTDTIYFNKSWPSSASWVRFNVGTYSASQGVIDSSSVFQLGNPTSVTNSADRFLRDRYIALNGKKLNIGDATNTILQLDGTTATNRIGMFTAVPSVAIGIGGDVNRTMRMERAIPANTNGNNLTIQAGGATSGGLNREGGSLILNAGESTGDGSGGGGGGSGGIYFGTSDPDAGVSGTSDNFVFTRMSIIANGNVGIGNGSTSVSELLTLGEPFAKRGTLSMAGNAGGKVIIQPDTAAGTWTWTIPTTNGNPGDVLTTDGSGVTSWAAATSGGSPIQIQDEGVNQGTAGQATTYNVTGKGGNVAVASTTATFNFPQLVAAAVGTGSLAANYFPYGVLQDSALWLSLERGGWYLRKTASVPLQSDNGLNVHNSWTFVEDDLDTLHFDCAAYNKARINFEDTDVYVKIPQNYSSNYNSEPFVLEFKNNSSVDSHYVSFDTTFFKLFTYGEYFPPMPRILITGGGTLRRVVFYQEFWAEGAKWICDANGRDLDSAAISGLGFLHNGGENVEATVGTITRDSLKFIMNDSLMAGIDTTGNFFIANQIEVSGGNGGLAGEALISQGPGLSTQYKRIGAQYVTAAVGATTTLAWNEYSNNIHCLVQSAITSSGTIIELPDPSVLLGNLSSITVKFTVIDALYNATITTVGGSAVIENGGAFVSSITVTGSDDFASWTWFCDGAGNKWYLMGQVP